MPPSIILAAALALAQATPDGPKTTPDNFKPNPAWKKLGNSAWFDPSARRLVVRARVALTDGFLEHLLCLERTKEHESVLATEAPPKVIHAGLLLTGAEPGHPVRFQPQFEPPAGTPITIELEWTGSDGKTQRANAKDWVKDRKANTTLALDWVFAGSNTFVHPDTGKTIYAADGGDLITVSNFTSSILDLPISSPAADEAREFVANSARIPPRGTRVTMYFRPAPPNPSQPKPAPRPRENTPQAPK